MKHHLSHATSIAIIALALCACARTATEQQTTPDSTMSVAEPKRTQPVVIDTTQFIDTTTVVDTRFPDTTQLRSIVVSYVGTLQQQDFDRLNKMCASHVTRCLDQHDVTADDVARIFADYFTNDLHANEVECEVQYEQLHIRTVDDGVMLDFPLTLYVADADDRLSEYEKTVTLHLNRQYRITHISERTMRVFESD